jgi:hypothetical protein
MSTSSIPSEFRPGNDPTIRHSPTTDRFRDHFSCDPSTVQPDELRGSPVSEAEDAYVGLRRAEDQNRDFPDGTKHAQAKSRYRRILDTDRFARGVFDEPVVGMQTLVFDPSEIGETIGAVEQVTLTTTGATNAIRRTRERLQGDRFVYFGVRDIDTDGLSHWHIYWCVDSDDTEVDSLDLYSGVESHIRHCRGATRTDHPAVEAVKWDTQPNSSSESYGLDSEYGGPVHPLARYVAGSLPHLGQVGEMTPRQVRHGTVEWAAPTNAYKGQNRGSLPSEFRDLSWV